MRRVHRKKGSDPRPEACKVGERFDALSPGIEQNVPVGEVNQYYRCVFIILYITSYYSQSKSKIYILIEQLVPCET